VPGSHAVSVLFDDEILTFNRVIGVVRRRNLPTMDFAVGPSERPGTLRLTFFVEADAANADRLLRQLEKTYGVRQAAVFTAADAVAGEVALVKVNARPEQRAAVLAVLSEFGASLVDEGPDALIAAAGCGRDAAALVRALQGFGVLELARSGAVLRRSGASHPALTHPSPEAVL
jgi:acetolactate synthase I/III small subunit